MENIRMRQAKNLIMKSNTSCNLVTKFNEPKSGQINVKNFECLFKDIIQCEKFIYSSLPSHTLSEEESKLFTRYLINARENIDSILNDFKVIEKKEDRIDINETTSSLLIITTKNSFKKSLKKLGIDVQRIIVSGVPLNSEDIKKINPEIPEQALTGIKKKIEHVHNDINRKIASLNPKKILVLAEDDLNGQLLGKRVQEEYNASFYLNNDLKELTDLDLIEIFNNI